MRQQMATKEMIVIPDDDEESCAAVSKAPPPAAPVEPPPPARTPPRAPSTPPPARPSTRSPPRYPSTSPGTAKVVTVPVLRLEAARCLQGLQTSALSELHSIMRTSRLMRMKCPGHLRKLIRMEIMMPWLMTMTAMTSGQGFPANCPFNKAWWLPDQFKPCGDKCEGAWCFPVNQPLHR